MQFLRRNKETSIETRQIRESSWEGSSQYLFSPPLFVVKKHVKQALRL